MRRLMLGVDRCSPLACYAPFWKVKVALLQSVCFTYRLEAESAPVLCAPFPVTKVWRPLISQARGWRNPQPLPRTIRNLVRTILSPEWKVRMTPSLWKWNVWKSSWKISGRKGFTPDRACNNCFGSWKWKRNSSFLLKLEVQGFTAQQVSAPIFCCVELQETLRTTPAGFPVFGQFESGLQD